MKFIQILSVFFILFSCEKPKNKSEPVDYFYGYVVNSKNNQNVLLTIKTRFDECGEWGGHTENIIVFNKNNSKKLYAKYEETKADCSNGNLNPKIAKTNESEINVSQKTDIKNYLKELIEFKSNSIVRGNSAMSYSAISQDSTFTIYLYDNNPDTKNAFEKLKSNLKF